MNIISRSIALAFAMLIAVPLLAAPSKAQEFPKNILTGGPNGTYIQIGRDLSREMARCGLTLNVRESAGSLENFLGVRSRRHTQFGIVQSDVLEYLRTYASEDRDIARAIAGVRILAPLYNEEVHILAKREIGSLSDLNGRRVAVGVEDSGTFLTASLVLDLAGIAPSERLTISAGDSLAGLLAGEIDAFFYVAGAPTKLFETDEISSENFHFLEINDETLKTVYVPAQLAAGTYPFQSDAVNVVAVKAVLMTYEYSPGRNRYHRQSCGAVSELANLLLTRFDVLQEVGHPKWKNVDLQSLPPGWKVSECVNAGLAEDFRLNCAQSEPEASTIENEANEAYRARICATIGC